MTCDFANPVSPSRGESHRRRLGDATQPNRALPVLHLKTSPPSSFPNHGSPSSWTRRPKWRLRTQNSPRNPIIPKEVRTLLYQPFEMFVRGPVVLCQSFPQQLLRSLDRPLPQRIPTRLQIIGFRHSSPGIGIHSPSHPLLRRLPPVTPPTMPPTWPPSTALSCLTTSTPPPRLMGMASPATPSAAS